MWIAGMAILMLGCQAEVIGGNTGGGGGGNHTTSGSVGTSGDGGSGGGAVDAGPPLQNDGPAIAMLYSEIPVYNPSPGSGGVTSGGSTNDPNTLFLFISDGAQSCADPNAQPAGCVTRYQISISLPPNLQAVGTYPLENLAFASITEAGDPGECSGGGGSFWDGTINVTAIDATQVTFTLAGTADFLLPAGSHADGTYTAKRCF